jgi:F0F1-type ATP synthase delta subunit
MEGKIYTAYALEPGEIAGIEAKFTEKLGGPVKLTQVVDNRLLAGFVVRIGFLRFDYSVGARLKEMKRHMLSQQ